MAIESIGHRIFTTQSDVWSFGIMLWEFFTLAKKPYTGIEAEELYQKLIEGYRMKQPNYAIREIYNIMLQCWETEPASRPSFTNLVESIGNLLEESVKMYYINLNTQYIDMNEINLNVNPGCSKDESEICNPHPLQDHSHIEFPSPESNCEDDIELSPMLKHEEDAHLKPIKNTSKKQNLFDESKQ